MDEPGGHNTKWNKPDTERQILYEFTYMWNLHTQKKEGKNADYQGLIEEENGEMSVKDTEFQLYKIDVLELYHVTMNIVLHTSNF